VAVVDVVEALQTHTERHLDDAHADSQLHFVTVVEVDCLAGFVPDGVHSENLSAVRLPGDRGVVDIIGRFRVAVVEQRDRHAAEVVLNPAHEHCPKAHLQDSKSDGTHAESALQQTQHYSDQEHDSAVENVAKHDAEAKRERYAVEKRRVDFFLARNALGVCDSLVHFGHGVRFELGGRIHLHLLSFVQILGEDLQLGFQEFCHVAV